MSIFFPYSRGIGGGGALFGPSIIRHDLNLMFVTCDMSEVFRSTDGGKTWSTIDARMLQVKPLSQVTCSLPNANGIFALYTANASVSEGDQNQGVPALSLDGGATWANITGTPSNISVVIGDWTRVDHIIFSSGATLYSGTWSLTGTTFKITKLVNPTSAGRVAGAFFDPGGTFFVATLDALFYSTAAVGTGFVSIPGGLPGLNGPERIVSFAGAADPAGNRRFWAVTVPSSTTVDNLEVPGHFKDDLTKLYYVNLDANWTPGSPLAWTQIPFDPDPVEDSKYHPQLVAAAGTEFRAYVATHIKQGGHICAVHRVTDTLGLELIFYPDMSNTVIRTGWGGAASFPAFVPELLQPHYAPSPDQAAFLTFSPPSGLTAVPDPPTGVTQVILADTAQIHQLVDDAVSAATWQQIYLQREDPNGSNPEGYRIDAAKSYRGVGLEPTVCTWIDWLSSTELRASFNDIATIRSTDGGDTWSFGGERWERPSTYQSGDPFLGDISQTVHYAEGPGGPVHEFAIRHHLDPRMSFPYSSIDSLKDRDLPPMNFKGGLHKRLVPPKQQDGWEKHALWSPDRISEIGGTAPRWTLIKANFGNPLPGDGVIDNGVSYEAGVPVWMTIDETRQRLYVSVASGIGGAVWYCDDPIPSITNQSTWSRIKTTGKHPYNIRLLASGTKLLVSQNGHLIPHKDANGTESLTDFTDPQTSGVWTYRKFVGDGEHWHEDVDAMGQNAHFDDNLKSWTQDVVLDPADPAEKTWLACVWTMAHPGLNRFDVNDQQIPSGNPPGGLFRTADGGDTWEKIFPSGGAATSVTSCSIHPETREIFICTRYDGLYYCSSVDDLVNNPELAVRTDYPFRAPTRVFFSPANPFTPKDFQIWVTSNGNGLCQLLRHGGSVDFDIQLGARDRAKIAEVTANSADRVAGEIASRAVSLEEIDSMLEDILSELSGDLLDDRSAEDLRPALRREIERILRSPR